MHQLPYFLLMCNAGRKVYTDRSELFVMPQRASEGLGRMCMHSKKQYQHGEQRLPRLHLWAAKCCIFTSCLPKPWVWMCCLWVVLREQAVTEFEVARYGFAISCLNWGLSLQPDLWNEKCCAQCCCGPLLWSRCTSASHWLHIFKSSWEPAEDVCGVATYGNDTQTTIGGGYLLLNDDPGSLLWRWVCEWWALHLHWTPAKMLVRISRWATYGCGAEINCRTNRQQIKLEIY